MSRNGSNKNTEGEGRSFLERLGYDKRAHDSQSSREWVIDRLVKNYKAQFALYIVVIVVALVLIAVKVLGIF